MDASGFCLTRIGASVTALTVLEHQARKEALDQSDGLSLTRANVVHLLGEDGMKNLVNAVFGVLQDLRLQAFTIFNWRFLQPVQRRNKEITVKDQANEIEGDAVSMLLSLGGQGRVRVVIACSPASVRSSPFVSIGERQCMVFNGSIAYTLMSQDVVFLQCICSSVEIPSTHICKRVNFACPYKQTLSSTEIQAYSKKFPPNERTELACVYSAQTWKNILDHLSVCKLNSAIDRAEERKQCRRVANAQTSKCVICGKISPSRNAARQHKRRHHRGATTSGIQNELLSVFDTIIGMTATSRTQLHPAYL